MTYDKPEKFKNNTTNIFHNMNIILDELTKRIESLQGVARFLHSRLNEMEDRTDILEEVTIKLVNESGKLSSDIHKRVSSSILNEEDNPENIFDSLKTIPSGSESRAHSLIGGVTETKNSLEKVQGLVPTETPSEKPKRKYVKKHPDKKFGRPKKLKSSPKLESQYKEVYNPDTDIMQDGIE